MKDEAEQSIPSRGSHGEPVAWLIHCGGEWQMVSLFREHADAAADENDGEVVPLYLHPTLTDEERQAVGWFSNFDRPQNGPVIGRHAATLRKLLERLGGCTPQLDCGADRKSVASQRCRDTGGQPFDSAPTTALTAEEREAIEWATEEAKRIADAAWFGDASLERRWVALRLLARRLG